MRQQVKFFRKSEMLDLERVVNEFIKGKSIINMSYSTSGTSSDVWHYAVVLYTAF